MYGIQNMTNSRLGQSWVSFKKILFDMVKVNQTLI